MRGGDRGEYLAALDQLESDGFSHIILHVQRPNAEISQQVSQIENRFTKMDS